MHSHVSTNIMQSLVSTCIQHIQVPFTYSVCCFAAPHRADAGLWSRFSTRVSLVPVHSASRGTERVQPALTALKYRLRHQEPKRPRDLRYILKKSELSVLSNILIKSKIIRVYGSYYSLCTYILRQLKNRTLTIFLTNFVYALTCTTFLATSCERQINRRLGSNYT